MGAAVIFRQALWRHSFGARLGQQQLMRWPFATNFSYGPTLDAPDYADEI
jgi:hypothetical protein